MEGAYGHGAGDIFLAAAPFALLALIAVLFIKEVPLRQHNGDPVSDRGRAGIDRRRRRWRTRGPHRRAEVR